MSNSSFDPPRNAGSPPPPPGAPSYPTGASAPHEHPKGTTVLVLGILGFVCCAIVSPVAWVMGNNAIREIDAAPQFTYSNRGMVPAGRIYEIVGTLLWAAMIAIYVIFFVRLASAS